MTRNQKYYRKGQEKTRERAVDFQYRMFDEFSEDSYYWELEEYQELLRLGKRFGLMREFKENAIV